ncbi:heme exporter protein C [Sulfobacillus thermosulfidooxidans DSM 9293]|uniref:Heme exporter protein C n=1 Tax=Sulfobacillus thermosulfidooxidans (strain DSM 9293 / VKM B-1269 / AT-1) TaxID=929705 RepID=A0A1W1WI92_SULTA|nr:cytochrome c biogenesis protein CcsA [Sulfobacillus thermosulfidooxidans]SMC05987.1 heme exporter protein C [Sulfobacillus thermosulfidooxidans DSM 9293]
MVPLRKQLVTKYAVILVLPLFVAALYADLIWSPDDRVLGASQRIFYFHMGAAVVAALAFTLTFGASLGYLLIKDLRWDHMAAASAEIGTVFTAMVLFSGILWGKAAWGVWWTWDPRLTSTLILWVLFAGYLLLREWSEDLGKRATYSAVLAIVAYIDVPIDYMAVRWWRSVHPVVITTQGIHMAPKMVDAMLLSMVAMMAIFVIWMVIRMRLLDAEWRLRQIYQRRHQVLEDPPSS